MGHAAVVRGGEQGGDRGVLSGGEEKECWECTFRGGGGMRVNDEHTRMYTHGFHG